MFGSARLPAKGHPREENRELTTANSPDIYPIDLRPPAGRTLTLALQHVLTMFGVKVAVPLLLGISAKFHAVTPKRNRDIVVP